MPAELEVSLFGQVVPTIRVSLVLISFQVLRTKIKGVSSKNIVYSENYVDLLSRPT